VPKDQVCLVWFTACLAAIVTEAGRLARLEFDRVIDELEPSSQGKSCAPESARSSHGHTPRRLSREEEAPQGTRSHLGGG
jgi:hypothetical protein